MSSNINLNTNESVNENTTMSNKSRLEVLKSIIDVNVEYNGFKFKNDIYYLNDDVVINIDNRTAIAKIIQIYPINGISENYIWPSIKVKWYYTKSDIINLNYKKQTNNIAFENFSRIISEYELFTSNHTDTVNIESIITKCTVLTFENYEVLEEIERNVYFTRSHYDPINVRFFLNRKNSDLQLEHGKKFVYVKFQ